MSSVGISEVPSCAKCKHSVPMMYKNKERKVCCLANKVTVKCITGGRQSYEPITEESNEEYI